MAHSRQIYTRYKKRTPKGRMIAVRALSHQSESAKKKEKEAYVKLLHKLIGHPLYEHVKQGMYRDMMREVETILQDIERTGISPQASLNAVHHMLMLAYSAAHEAGIQLSESIAESGLSELDGSQHVPFASLREHILKHFQMLAEYCQSKVNSGHQKIVQKMKQYIDQHYKDRITLNTLAHHFNMSASYLSHLFREHTSSNFIEYLTHVRIQKAKELLRVSDMRVYEIADAIGYRDAHYFSAAFKKIVGVSPSEYRERLEQEA